MWVLFFLSFFPLISFIFDVFGVIQNHQIIPSPNHTWNTYLCFCEPPFFTFHHITVWTGVFLLAFSSSPSILGEGAYALGARRGNSPARRGDRGEILLPRRCPGNIPASIWVTKHSSNFFLLSHCSNLSRWKLISLTPSCYYTLHCQFLILLI